MKATEDFELAKRFRELLEIPERVNDMSIVETKEMMLYCFNNNEKWDSPKLWDNISVKDNLLIHYNQKLQKTKLSKDVITNHNFHRAMDYFLRWRWEPEEVVSFYEKMLFMWENKGIGDDFEKKVIKQIIEFFNDPDKPFETEVDIHQNSTQPTKERDNQQSTIVDNILKDMFNLSNPELENLKLNLMNNGRHYVSLTYIGSKTKLWKDLAKLRSAGVDRKEIARVFSDYCMWKKSTASQTINLDPGEIYKKIDKKMN